MLTDNQKANYLKALKYLEAFEAEVQLEDEIFSGYASKLLTLPMDEDKIALRYAEVRGAMEALKHLKAMRERAISSAVEK